MNNQEILTIAMQQSAIECNCRPEDFLCSTNKVVTSTSTPNARKYLTTPFDCHLVSYGNNIVASVREELKAPVQAYLDKNPIEYCFATPNIYELNASLAKFNLQVSYMSEYFLPDVEKLKLQDCPYELKVLTPPEFAGYYQLEWRNALSNSRKDLDRLAVGAFDQGKLIGLVGCSADCETMWQFGVDVLPEYRQQGIASALTRRLTLEVLSRGIVPFYGIAWANLASLRNALESGYRPAWVELSTQRIVSTT